jgi:3-deoxy-D-manno-octulosonic-acid transferase
MLDVLQPALIVFSKLDVWPVLVIAATQRGIPCVLVSGTVAPRSGRLNALVRSLLAGAYNSLSAVGAIDTDNANRLQLLGANKAVVRITGDTRFDQVAERARDVDRNTPPLSSLASQRPTLVAGSTWPADEAVLLPAWIDVAGKNEAVRPRLIIAPHEPTETHLRPLEEWAAANSLAAARFDAATAESDVVLVDRVGLLGHLYALASVAFVGGGFHDAGLHSVIEPAAFGAPVIFGPRHDMSREAGLLLRAGGARSVEDGIELRRILSSWLTDESARSTAGEAARLLVEGERGAVGRTLELLSSVLPSGVISAR